MTTPLEERFNELQYQQDDILKYGGDPLRIHIEKEVIRTFLEKNETSETRRREEIFRPIQERD